MRVEFNGLRFNLPQGWADITDDLPPGTTPTLARSSGVGVIQVTIAQYRSGERPNVTIKDLRALLDAFCRRNEMHCDTMVDREGRVSSVCATAMVRDELISATYLTNGKDVVLVTYVCSEPESGELAEDLSGMSEIVNSIDF